MKRFILSGYIVGLAAVGAIAAIVPPASMPTGSTVPCPHPTPGYTRTLDMTWVGLDDLTPYLDVLNSQPVNDQFDGDWHYETPSGGFSGTLSIPIYFPFDSSTKFPPYCLHGCAIELSLAGLSLPASQHFQWLQYFNESGSSGNRQNTIDPPAGAVVDGKVEDGLPFYYNATESGWESTFFSDAPSDRRRDATSHAGGVSFVTLLTSWDGSDPTGVNEIETVAVYGAVLWGYTYACPDSGSSFALLILALGSVFGVRKYRRQMSRN
jgi:hypothetical protein